MKVTGGEVDHDIEKIELIVNCPRCNSNNLSNFFSVDNDRHLFKCIECSAKFDITEVKIITKEFQ